MKCFPDFFRAVHTALSGKSGPMIDRTWDGCFSDGARATLQVASFAEASHHFDANAKGTHPVGRFDLCCRMESADLPRLRRIPSGLRGMADRGQGGRVAVGDRWDLASLVPITHRSGVSKKTSPR